MLLNKRTPLGDESGFTLVELLVTMLIVTVGLLGLAKLQATAVSNTAAARTRALMTYQAESLAGMIRANRDFWKTSGTVATWPRFAVSKAGVPSNTGMTAKTTCVTTVVTPSACNSAELAYDDMYKWAAQFNNGTATSAFPNASASIVCVPATGTTCGTDPVTPHGYDITLTWDQKLVAVNRSTVNTSSSMTQSVSMVMHVQP